MFRFFRHIRRNALADHRVARYFWYAIGEILLVVIGILIALQINNWNEARIEQRQNRESLLKLSADIRRDMEMIDPVEQQIRRVIYLTDELADYARGRPLDEVENAQLYYLMRGLGYRPYGWNRAGLEQLKNSGALRQVPNERLTDLISSYDALTHHLDQDFDNDQKKLEQVEVIASRIINLNYPQQSEINVWMDQIMDTDVVEKTVAFRDTALFEDIRAQRLPLLTGDITDVLMLVNTALMARLDLDARVDTELPRLRSWAAEIITLIEDEYQ